MRYLLIAFLLAGCTTPVTPPRVESAPTVAAQENKDVRILTSADKIDVAVKDTPPEQIVRTETAVIRQAVAEAPAADVAKLAAAFEVAIKALEKQNASLLVQIEKERTRALREQVRYLNIAGMGLVAAFGISIFFGSLTAMAKTWPLLLLAAGCFGLAQVVGHPWFMRGFLGISALGLGYLVYWVIDRHRQGRLQQAIAKRADKLKEMVPVLDEAYENAGDDLKKALDSKIFDRLSAIWSKEDKAVIHQVRADVKSAPQPL